MNVALCAIAKCENLYINEWAEYHLNLGFDHIYVYDNNEIDGEKISDVLSDDRITVVNYRGKHQSSCETQVKAYNECYNGYGKMYDWIMFIDIDEFLTLENFGNIKDFLSQKCFADAKAVRFHWKCYSDSGKLKYEAGSVISRFTELCENGEVNKYYKQIYRTKIPKFKMMNVHYCDFIGGICYPDGSSAKYVMQTTDPNVKHECGCVRHYVTKSLEEFVDIKWKRRGNGSSKTRLNKDFYFKYNKKTEEKSRYFDEYFANVSNGVHPTGNSIAQHNTITHRLLKPKIMPYQQEPPIKSQTQSLGNVDYRTPQERAVCPGANKTNNPAIKHGLPQKPVQNNLSVSEYDIDEILKNKDDKIIVSFTSWEKRIHNCAQIVDLMLGQTLKPDKIILNLSSDEFVNKEDDLPKELVDKQDSVFEIYWVKENTRVYKKIAPTFERFPNDVIVSIDDDIEYPKNFIEILYSYYLKNGKKHPITSGTYKWDNDIYTHYGCFSLLKKDMIYPYYDDLYKNVVLKNGFDKIPFADPIITYSVLLNGNRYIYTDTLNMSEIRKRSRNDKKDRYSNIGTNAYLKIMDNEHNIIRKYIFEKYKKTYNDLTKDTIVVNFTTWKKRDMYVPEMLKRFMLQTKKPDKIVLWLSEEEYDRDDLPIHLQDCLRKGLLTDIMWVERNTYCHKRFDCFKHFNNCYNIFVDDDIFYANDFVEMLYENAKKHPNCVVVYSTNSVYYNGYSITKKDAIIGASHYNAFMGGRCCFPPNILPDEVFEKTELRDLYVTKCDESWIRPVLIKHNIKVYSIMTYKSSQYKNIDGTQDDSVWNENKVVLKNGMREKERNFYNSIKIHNAETVCKKLWPNMSIDQWTLKKSNEL